MKNRVVKGLFFSSIIGSCLILTVSLSAQDEFRARLVTTGGPVQEKVMNVKITIESYTTADDVRQLQRVLSKSSSAEFLTTFREIDKGVIRFMGARGLNLRINAVQSRPTEDGMKILIFTERQSWDVHTDINISGKYFFMVVELEMDHNRKWTGKFYKAANINLSQKGIIEIESYESPMMLIGVRKTK